MKKKLIATVMAATMAVTALTGCGSSSASSAKKDIKVPTKPFGDTVKYDPSVEINDGKDNITKLVDTCSIISCTVVANPAAALTSCHMAGKSA